MTTNTFLYTGASDLRDMVETNDFLKSLYKEDSTMKFPNIVVVGDQSHGKTSLIENITNLNLPRGTGIQTRVPTEIQLRNSPANHYTIRYRPMGETQFKTVEFNEDNLEEKLRRVQEEVTGSETKIADDLITLTIERPDLLPLTIIDLPGFVFQSIEEGGSENEISVTMRNLYTKFISQEQNIVVCVLNAANDIENSAVLKLCLELDRMRNRTVVVVTKIDLRTSAGFENYRKGAQKFHVKKMFFTRSKTDEERMSNVKSDEVREREKKFIAGHKELSKFPDNVKGVLALRNYLVELQKELIVPSIRANYDKIKALLDQKQKEQAEIAQTIDRPEESKEFIRTRLNMIFVEIRELYYNQIESIHGDNFYHKDHKVGEHGDFEAVLGSKKMPVQYTVSESEGQHQLIFAKGLKEVINVELMTKSRKRTNKNVDLENPEPVFIALEDFWLSMRFLSDKDFMYFRERIAKLYQTFQSTYGLDYFISDHFMQVYENHERAINTTNSLPDRDFSQLAESILFKDVVPKLTYEIEQFKKEAVHFAHQMFIVRINAQFRNYPNLRALLTRTIDRALAEPVNFINDVIAVLCENSFKISTTDAMYRYKVDYLKSLFKQGGVDASNDFLKIVCGDLDYTTLREVYMGNKRVYKNALRVWAYISNIFPALKDNVVKTVQNHLLQDPINSLKEKLQALFDENFFRNPEEVARMMRPSPRIFARQQELQNDIDRMRDGLLRITNLPKKHPQLQKEFDFIQESELDSLIKGGPDKLEGSFVLSSQSTIQKFLGRDNGDAPSKPQNRTVSKDAPNKPAPPKTGSNKPDLSQDLLQE